jgi:hypothetical protein
LSTRVPLWRWKLLIVWTASSGVLGVISWFTPLINTLGYEFALFSALIVSLGAGHLAACYPHRVRNQLARFPGAHLPVLVLYLRVLGFGAIVAATPVAFSLLGGLWLTQCNLKEGLLFYLLMPTASMLVACAAGLSAGLFAPGFKSASALWIVMFTASISAAIYGFYDTPAVFAFGPFFGYFPGVLYDELIRIEPRLFSYRLISLIHVVTLLTISASMLDLTSLRLCLKKNHFKTWKTVVALFSILASILAYHSGPSLGHRTERGNLNSLLPDHILGDRIQLQFPAGTPSQVKHALKKDAEFSLHQVEHYLGYKTKKKISVFFFSDKTQKARAMGAAGTNVAKPWRAEIYVLVQDPPHSVLRHELAHVVAAGFGRGPFKISGSLNGWWPNPGLIEGIAVAAQGPRGDLTTHQWAATMRKLKMLPSLQGVFGLGFFNLAASTAYTAAGSFCAWVRDRHGAQALRQVYTSGGNWSLATGKDLAGLETSWLAFLDKIQLAQADLTAARNRFDRPGVIHSVCVHEVAKLKEHSRQLAALGSTGHALAVGHQANERSNKSGPTLANLFFLYVDADQVDDARDLANNLLGGPAVGGIDPISLEETLIDLDVRETGPANSASRYQKLSLRAGNETVRRRLEVKSHLSSLPKTTTEGLFEVLARRPGSFAMSRTQAALEIAKAHRLSQTDPVITYLLARQHFNHGDWTGAIELLQESMARGLSLTTPSIWLEARMLEAKALYYSDQPALARRRFDVIFKDTSVREGARALALDWVARTRFN